MIYSTPCIMFLMRTDTLRGQVGGGWALEMESFLGPVKWHRAERRVPFGAQKTRDVQGPIPSHLRWKSLTVFTFFTALGTCSNFQYGNKLGKEISTLCYFSPFLRMQLFFPVLYSFCFSFTSPSEDVYKGTGILQLSFTKLEFIFVCDCESVERK